MKNNLLLQLNNDNDGQEEYERADETDKKYYEYSIIKKEDAAYYDSKEIRVKSIVRKLK